MTKTSIHMPTWLALLLTLAMVVLVREGCLWVCVQLGMAQAANIVGLVVLFLLLMGWRVWRGFAGGLPTWLTTASSLLLMESGFALITKEIRKQVSWAIRDFNMRQIQI